MDYRRRKELIMKVIKNKDVAKLFNCSLATATRRMQLFRRETGRHRYCPIPESEFLSFYHLDGIKNIK